MSNALQVSTSNDVGELIDHARRVILAEADAVAHVATRLDWRFAQAVERIVNCPASLIISGIGKAGLIGKKLAATFASTGTPSHFIHPGEAVHGDLGRITANDLVLILSYSGETDEIVRMLPAVRATSNGVLAITRTDASTLGKAADVVLPLGDIAEAGHLGLAPSVTTTAMLALGDALALVVSRQRGFTSENFARNHPGGSLGRRLSTVDQAMRPLADCRVADQRLTVREVLMQVAKPGRRTGAIMLTNERGTLTGIFTDSDLARLLEQRGHNPLDCPIATVMTKKYLTVDSGSKLPHAVSLMVERKISELPILNAAAKPIGIIDITDVIGFFSPAELAQPTAVGSLQASHSHVPEHNYDEGVRAEAAPTADEMISIPMFRKTSI